MSIDKEMLRDFSFAKWSSRISGLREMIVGQSVPGSECFLGLSGRKTVRLVTGDPRALKLVRRELGWIITEPVESPDATVYLWQEKDVKAFTGGFIGEPVEFEPGDDYVLFRVAKDVVGQDNCKVLLPSGQVNVAAGSVYLADGNDYFYGVGSFEPENWIADGHVLVQILFRILNKEPDAKLVHGACVGLDGKGLLVCARGQKGKSTLAVTAMLEGFDFVSEDYLILEREGRALYASPLYSMVTLSPLMYDKLYDALGKARFIGVGPFKGKYLFDISDYRDQVRWRYPVRACVFPEITPEATEPRFEPCDPAEKNRAITHMAHSTLSQMWTAGLKQEQTDQEFILAVVRMLRGLDFYRLVLTTDIFRNVECLKSLVSSIK